MGVILDTPFQFLNASLESQVFFFFFSIEVKFKKIRGAGKLDFFFFFKVNVCCQILVLHTSYFIFV